MDWLRDVYLVCALVGGTLLVVQTVMMVFGFGGDHDVGHDVGGLGHGDVGHVGDDLSFVKWLSLKTVVSCLTFFGLAGLAADTAGLSPLLGLALAVVAGTLAIFFVGLLMASLSKLQSRGNLDLQNAVGLTGRVYLRVPAARRGRGKVTLDIQGRSVEVDATTAGPEIATGVQVRVLHLLGDDTLDVTPLLG